MKKTKTAFIFDGKGLLVVTYGNASASKSQIIILIICNFFFVSSKFAGVILNE